MKAKKQVLIGALTSYCHQILNQNSHVLIAGVI